MDRLREALRLAWTSSRPQATQAKIQLDAREVAIGGTDRPRASGGWTTDGSSNLELQFAAERS
jgi:hypothetical protein